jgi:hypothetical protein
MLVGVGAIAASSASSGEQKRWKEAAQREGRRYGVDAEYVEARMEGRQASGEEKPSRTLWDWLLVALASGVFLVLALMARVPQIAVNWGMVGLLTMASLALLLICGLALWKTTRFQ